MLAELQKLTAIEEIKHLKARYFRYVDAKDWPCFRSVFTDDAVWRRSDPQGVAVAQDTVPIGGDSGGADAIIALIREALSAAKTVHFGHMPEIEVLSETDARGVWAMEDYVQWPDRHLHGMGQYVETYRRVGGRWLIDSFRLDGVRVDLLTYSFAMTDL
jgi:hypothetical protein